MKKNVRDHVPFFMNTLLVSFRIAFLSFIFMLAPDLSCRDIISHSDATFPVYGLLYADREAIADLLNPLIISHNARTISFTAIGRYKRVSIF